MASNRIQLELPDELYAQLVRVGESMGISNPGETATVGLAQWLAQRIAKLDDKDPSQKYLVNEALDELLEKHK
ncbi:MAG: hypothetical protein Q7S58_19400 [Candidatus Binatus sp.]|uniref:hypothetical protein n=1 Tax=Candidatus Binatus sp. TaxID=2811406 RepID=UPI00271AF50D|nr:hypothetical protein [Candidatus Binatus sp.]MDO8434569.1 hypothetical protein [Candidatus Binatus sp.]